MAERLRWEHEGRDWPNREASRFVDAAGLRWHVQWMGQGPPLLLLHGTGASTHSWRDLAPLLATHFTVVAPDLPGHGFSDALPRHATSLPGIARALNELLRALDLQPAYAAGHSAGAALLAQMALGGSSLRHLVALNGALLPFSGWAGLVFAPMARLLVRNPLVPHMFAWQARDGASVRRLIASTGSTLDPRGIELYGRLVRSPAHVAGALRMMAGWDLAALARELPRLQLPLLLLVGDADRTVPPAQSHRVAARLPQARVVTLPGLGHLAHEEQPQQVAQLMRAALLGQPP
jgi:magnesium chelatase accessory protein